MNRGTGRCFSAVSACAALLLFSAACRVVNQYENNYCPSAQGVKYDLPRPGTPPVMLEIEDWDQVRTYQEKEHYAVIGYSVFSQGWVPRHQALDFAKKLGVPLVLVYSKVEEDPRAASFLLGRDRLPAGGVFIPPRSYNWLATLHGTVPVTVNESGAFYHHAAFYLAKRRHINRYGVYFLFSRLDGDTRVRVAAVTPGSKAERDGIRRGDLVVSINGKRVRGPKDVEPFAENRRRIYQMEVEHE